MPLDADESKQSEKRRLPVAGIVVLSRWATVPVKQRSLLRISTYRWNSALLACPNHSDRAILDLKVQRDKLHQYQRRLAPLVAQYKQVAAYHLQHNDKQRALLALRRKKYHESLIAKTDQQLAQLEALTTDVEFALVQKDVVFGLQRGTEVLKEIRKEMGGVEGVEKLMARNEEERQFADEVADMLSGQMTREEEGEVEDELEAIEREQAARNVEKVDLPKVPDGRLATDERLPTTPNAAPTSKVEQEEESDDRELLRA